MHVHATLQPARPADLAACLAVPCRAAPQEAVQGVKKSVQIATHKGGNRVIELDIPPGIDSGDQLETQVGEVVVGSSRQVWRRARIGLDLYRAGCEEVGPQVDRDVRTGGRLGWGARRTSVRGRVAVQLWGSETRHSSPTVSHSMHPG